MSRAYGARSIMAAAFESSYGTAPGSGFLAMPFLRSSLGGAAPLLAEDVLGQGRDPLAPQLDAEDVDGDIEVPIDAEAIGVWLKSALGAPATSGSMTYEHEFSSGGWALPSLSIETGLPEVPHYAMTKGAVVDRISFSQTRRGYASATIGLVGQSEADAGSTAAGTPTEFSYSRFVNRQGVLTRGGSALASVTGAELTYQNNLDRIETVNNGGLIEGADPTMASLTGRLTMRFANETLYDAAIAGDPSAFTFGYDDGTNSLIFSVPKLYLPKPKRTIEGPGGIQATFEFQAAQDDGDPMLVATLTNAVASY